jgi:hypothetical protein
MFMVFEPRRGCPLRLLILSHIPYVCFAEFPKKSVQRRNHGHCPPTPPVLAFTMRIGGEVTRLRDVRVTGMADRALPLPMISKQHTPQCIAPA